MISSYQEGILILLGINILLGWSVYLPITTAQASIGNAGFMAVGAYVSSLLTLNSGFPLFFAVIVGGVADALRGASIAPGQGIAGWVAQHRQSALVNDVRHDPRWHDGIDRSIGFQTRSLICTPLVYHEQVTGVIEIVNKRADEFTEDDLSLLEAVASITASALENARLYMTTRARAEELALLHEMGLALISTLDPATVIHVALNQIMRLFQAERVSLFEPDRRTGEMHFVKALFKPKLISGYRCSCP